MGRSLRPRVDTGLSREEVAARREQVTARAIELRKQGMRWSDIAEETGTPAGTLHSWVAPAVPPELLRPMRPKPKPKPPPEPTPAVRGEMSPEIAARVLVMHKADTPNWTIAKRLGVRVNLVEKVIAAAKLDAMVRDGRLKIRFAKGAELKRLRLDRERHDRKALQERDHLLQERDRATSGRKATAA